VAPVIPGTYNWLAGQTKIHAFNQGLSIQGMGVALRTRMSLHGPSIILKRMPTHGSPDKQRAADCGHS